MLDEMLPTERLPAASGAGEAFLRALCDPQLDPLFWRAELLYISTALGAATYPSRTGSSVRPVRACS